MRTCVAARDRVSSIYIKGHVRRDYEPLSGKCRPPPLVLPAPRPDLQPTLTAEAHTELQIRSRITKISGQPEGEMQRCQKISFI